MSFVAAILSLLITVFCLIFGPLLGTFGHLPGSMKIVAWLFWIIPAIITRSAFVKGIEAMQRRDDIKRAKKEAQKEKEAEKAEEATAKKGKKSKAEEKESA